MIVPINVNYVFLNIAWLEILTIPLFVKQETNYFHSFRIKELLISTKALTM